MSDASKDVNTIARMERSDFRNLLHSIAKREDFSRLVCLGIDNITEEEKQAIRLVLATHGITLEKTQTDLSLNAIAHSITARAVELR